MVAIFSNRLTKHGADILLKVLDVSLIFVGQLVRKGCPSFWHTVKEYQGSTEPAKSVQKEKTRDHPSGCGFPGTHLQTLCIPYCIMKKYPFSLLLTQLLDHHLYTFFSVCCLWEDFLILPQKINSFLKNIFHYVFLMHTKLIEFLKITQHAR